MYDWKSQDIWIFHRKFKQYSYNKIYDLMFRAGVKIKDMRLCQPYGDDQKKGLWLFHILEPQTWVKIVDRVSGANSGALYCNEFGSINGNKRISKPNIHTWKSYYEFLINSMPENTKNNYITKINKFIEMWELRGYKNRFPQEAPSCLERKQKVPTYRRICKSIFPF
jgi:predicted phosphoadenosine phosphosulfate sulfurtransferase